jgi:hypothetical protein
VPSPDWLATSSEANPDVCGRGHLGCGYEQLKSEGRLLRPVFWDACTLFDVTFHPKLMSVNELEDRFRRLMLDLYNLEESARRKTIRKKCYSQASGPALRRVTRVKRRSLNPVTEPSPVSPTDSPNWALLQRTIRQIFRDIVVAPYLTLGATDARYYAGLSRNIYRFLPVRLTPQDLTRLHGTDERVSIANYAEAVRFYAGFLHNAAGYAQCRGIIVEQKGGQDSAWDQ